MHELSVYMQLSIAEKVRKKKKSICKTTFCSINSHILQYYITNFPILLYCYANKLIQP